MPRRPIDDGADLSLADSDSDGRIEIIDPGALTDPDHGAEDVVESSPGRSPLGVVTAVALGVLAAVGVVRTGNTPAPEPPAPSVTTQPEPLSDAELARMVEIAELEEAYGVEIGDGPGLRWQQVLWNIDTTFFYWLDDGFVGTDGTTEWTIRLSEIGPTVAQRESLQQQYPGYDLRHIDGARVLLPNEAEDHLLVITGDPGNEPIEIELPPPSIEASTDLVTVDRLWVNGVALDDAAIIIGIEQVGVDVDALAPRLGLDLADVVWAEVDSDRLNLWSQCLSSRCESAVSPTTIPFDETDLTEAEIADLRLTSPFDSDTIALRLDLLEGRAEPLPFDISYAGGGVIRTNTGVGLAFMGDAGGSYATSTDGVDWSTISASTDGWLMPSGSRLYRFRWDGNEIQRSPDGGRTWHSTRVPLRNSFPPPVVADDVVFVTNEVTLDAPPAASTEVIEIDVEGPYRVILREPSGFELIDRSTGDPVAAERVPLEASSFQFFWAGADPDLVFQDPDTGEELVRVPMGAVESAVAAAQGAPPPTLAVTRWDPAVPNPEWDIRPIGEVFDNAVGVAFIPGDRHVLAVVSTSRGTDLYIAATRP